jgi:hypothetical protein
MKDCIINEPMMFAIGDSGIKYLYLKNSKYYIKMDDLKDCKFEKGAKFIIYTSDEAPPKKRDINKDKKNEYNYNARNDISFIDNSNYSLSPSKLKIERIILQNQKNEERVPENIDFISNSISDFFIGGIASIALFLSIFNQIKQKKKEIENNKCCINNKTQIENIKIEIQKNKDQCKEKNESSNKAIYAEIFEHYKELKETKEDLNNVKDILEKVIDKNFIQKGEKNVK